MICNTPVFPQGTEVENESLVNWYYAAALGTGFYSLGDRTVTVIRLPFSRRMRPVEDGRWGWRLTFPTTFGFHDFDLEDAASLDLPDELSTLSVVPGAEFEIPVRSNWTLKPYGNLGYGWDLSGDEGALIYTAGVRSLVELAWGAFRFGVGNSVAYAGYNPSDESSGSLASLAAGLDVRHPLGISVRERQLNIGVYFIYYFYFNELQFITSAEDSFDIDEEYEVAVSIDAGSPVSFWRFKLDRIGLAYRAGNEDLSAVRLVFRFPF